VAIPGTPGLMHRIGGIEKQDGTGNINYDPDNHELMTKLRAEKVARIASDIDPVEVDDPNEGSAGGLPRARVGQHLGCRKAGSAPSAAKTASPSRTLTLVHLNPFPANLGEVLARYDPRAHPRDEPWTALAPRARRVPGGRAQLDQGSGDPIPRGRDRDRDPRGGEVSDGNGATVTLGKKDFQSDQEVRWCPGCGDYSILSAMQLLLPDIGTKPENLVFVSGIGCAARFPYYMNVYGMHGIHGRAPALATGVALARPDLDVWVITGDGDALSIGGNHLVHALRRNIDMNIIMFNNQIYGLTKGQYSPTSEVGKVTKSSPFGSLDTPFNPVSVALGAEASFVARTHDMDRKHMIETFRRAHDHHGASFVEVYQNCNVFNDGAFEAITGKEVRSDMLIDLPPRRADPLWCRRRTRHRTQRVR